MRSAGCSVLVVVMVAGDGATLGCCIASASRAGPVKGIVLLPNRAATGHLPGEGAIGAAFSNDPPRSYAERLVRRRNVLRCPWAATKMAISSVIHRLFTKGNEHFERALLRFAHGSGPTLALASAPCLSLPLLCHLTRRRSWRLKASCFSTTTNSLLTH